MAETSVLTPPIPQIPVEKAPLVETSPVSLKSDCEIAGEALQNARKQRYLARTRRFVRENRYSIRNLEVLFKKVLLACIDELFYGDPDFLLIIKVSSSSDGLTFSIEGRSKTEFREKTIKTEPAIFSPALSGLTDRDVALSTFLEWTHGALDPHGLFFIKGKLAKNRESKCLVQIDVRMSLTAFYRIVGEENNSVTQKLST